MYAQLAHPVSARRLRTLFSAGPNTGIMPYANAALTDPGVARLAVGVWPSVAHGPGRNRHSVARMKHCCG